MSPEPGAHRPQPVSQPGPRTRAGQARSNRPALAVTVVIVLLGVAGAVLVLVRTRPESPSAGAGEESASIAAPPTFGASLPISAPAPTTSPTAAAGAELTAPAAASAVLAAAQTAIETVDSYDYRRLDKDRVAGDAASTGGFRARYDASLHALARSARRTKTVQQAVVQKLALTSLSAHAAGVLVFGRLETTTAADPAGATGDLAAGVTLQRVDGAWRISDTTDLIDDGEFVAAPPGNAALVQAITAGAREVVDLLSYSRADFTADFNRALAGLTRDLQTQQLSERDQLLHAMNQAQSDYAGQVRAIGVESASGTSVLLLVLATGYEVSAVRSAQPLSGTERFEVGVEFVHGRWLVSEYLALPSAS